MNQPLVSIICPSLNRVTGLLKMIHSIADSADEPENIEFCIRLHDDDEESIKHIPFILGAAPNVRILIGPTLRGYADLTVFFDDLYKMAKGTWVWHMNDDVVADGKGWDTKLKAMPTGQIIMPEIHRLGGSTYPRDERTCFHFLPREAVYVHCDSLPFPSDFGIIDLLKSRGWKIQFLEGVTAWHQRNVSREEELRREADEKL